MTAVAAVLIGALMAPSAAATPGNDADRIAAEISAVQRQANEAAASISTLNQQYEAVSVDVATLTAQQATLQGGLDALGQSLRAVALKRYVTAASDFTSVLGLSLRDPNSAAIGRYMTEFTTGGGAEQIDEYRTTAADLEKTATTLRQRQSQAARQRDSVTSAQAALLRRLEDLQAAQVKARHDAAVQTALARQRAADAAKIQAAAKPEPAKATAPGAAPTVLAVQARPTTAVPTAPAAKPKPSFAVGGGFVCPVIGATAFSDTYGDTHQGIRHLGVDMMGRLNQEIVAVVSGTVRHTHSGLGGNQIWLYGDDGNRYFYAHLNRYGPAGKVSAGQVIGYMGSTGDTGAIHLHFEVHPGGGAAVNPTPIAAAYC